MKILSWDAWPSLRRPMAACKQVPRQDHATSQRHLAADEMFLKIKGNLRYMYALMDDQTRFWIAQEVADTKYTADVRALLQLAKQVAGKQPKTFITDGAANFHEAYMQEFWTQDLDKRTEHIRHI